MRRVLMTATACAVLLGSGPVLAAPDAVTPLLQRTEKLTLKGRKGESLLRPGYAVGEYVGGATSVSRSVDIPGFHASDRLKTDFSIEAPSLGGKVSGACAGGESRTGLGWITFDRDELNYACAYMGGGAPGGAAFTLALSKGSWKARLQQSQRAGELRWGKATYRAETKRVGGLPFAGGRVMGYVFTRDGVEVGALDITMVPTFYLPPKGDPDRDAVAVMAISLFFFQDPANQNR
jgi:hypothetical protein